MMTIKKSRISCVWMLLLLAVTACASRPDWLAEMEFKQDEAARRISSALNVQVTAYGASVPDAINWVSLSFDSDEEWTRMEARQHFLRALDIFVDTMNESSLVQEHAGVELLGPKQVMLSLFYRLPAEEGEGPDAMVGLTSDRNVEFLSLPNTTDSAVSLHVESLEEARLLSGNSVPELDTGR